MRCTLGCSPMVPEVAAALSRLLDGRGEPGPDELVFLGEGGGYVDASALRRRYITAQREARLRMLRLHDLRHTFGSLAINRASIVQVQAWMGHADVKTTMRYLHHKGQADEAALLAGAFAPGPTDERARLDSPANEGNPRPNRVADLESGDGGLRHHKNEHHCVRIVSGA